LEIQALVGGGLSYRNHPLLMLLHLTLGLDRYQSL